MGKRSVFPVAASAAKLKLIMEANATLSAVAGGAEGAAKAVTNTPPDAPYLLPYPFYTFGSDVSNILTMGVINIYNSYIKNNEQNQSQDEQNK